MLTLPFQDRTEAGRLLGADLASRGLPENSIVLALPRGGVPVAAEISQALKAPLDLLVVRKLGVPWRPELAMGAISSAAQVLDHEVIHQLAISQQEVEAVVASEADEINRRERLYRGGLPPPDTRGRTVVLVDDGMATGATMVVAARFVRGAHPHKLIVAVPVASPHASKLLKEEADQCVCLAVPDRFTAVGACYRDFRQLTDIDVRKILEHNLSLLESAR